MRLARIGLLSVALACVSCGGIMETILPVVAEVITRVQDAEQILNQIDRAAAAYFAASPDPDKQEAFAQAMAKARSALNAANRAASGLDKLDQEAISAAFNDFKVAFQEVKNILGPLGVIRVEGDDMMLASSNASTVVIEKPLALAGQ